ncbi:MAG TPA: methyltransferase [Candidatus Aminicenantes bacterium]|nr:methyltransferase [Candidatus Aminicenantes bacterium]
MIGNVLAIAKGGAGIVRDGERTVFVPGVVAGETVEYDDAGRLHSAWRGRLLRVLEPSRERVPPPCPHYGDCGGCNLQHMSIAEQQRSKAAILAENLRRIAGSAPPSPPLLASPAERFRSKAEFQVAGGAAGFFARESHRVVAVGGCLLLPRASEEHFLRLRPRTAALERGQWRVLSNGDIVASRLEGEDGRGEWLSRERTVPFAIGLHEWRVGPENFVQANLFQLAPMAALLTDVVERERPGSAADLFCGAGFFTLPLAARCGRVTALESDPANLASLRANLERNRIGHVRVLAADALRGAPLDAELVVVDPPRGGLSGRLVSALAGGRARTVVYFSCDSATFARDLRLFQARGFALEALKLIDNFPHSDHFEIFSVLKRIELRDA